MFCTWQDCFTHELIASETACTRYKMKPVNILTWREKDPSGARLPLAEKPLTVMAGRKGRVLYFKGMVSGMLTTVQYMLPHA